MGQVYSNSTLKNLICIIYLEGLEDNTALCICRIWQEKSDGYDLY